MIYAETAKFDGTFTPVTFTAEPRVVTSPQGPRLTDQTGPRLRALADGKPWVAVEAGHERMTLDELRAVYCDD